MVKLIVGGQGYEIDEQTKDLMGYIADLEAIEKKDEIVLDNISKDSFERVLQACKVAQFTFPEIAKIKGNNAEQYIGKELNTFLANQPNNELNSLYKVSQFLKMNGLKNCIVAFLACRVYIAQNFDSYDKKRKELGVKNELTPERSQSYKLRCNFL